MNTIYKSDIDTPAGRIDLLSTEKGLCYVGLPSEKGVGLDDFIRRHFPGAEVEDGGLFNHTAAREIKAYFEGRLTEFTVPLDLQTQGFRRRVLQKVKSIPYGKTATYGEIAASLGNPKASRAVGGANGSNPIPIVIPCHRVVAANGLGGYGGGLELKERLLELEKSSRN